MSRHIQKGVVVILFFLVILSFNTETRPRNAPVKTPFKVLALAENGGHHIKYTEAAKVFLAKLAKDHNFSVDYIQSSQPIDEAFLSKYDVFLQLDFPPYTWSEKSMKAFQDFMQKGRGGWIGFHHATLLGEFDGYPMWKWFSDFMGGIRWKNYIGTFSTASVKVEDSSHPSMKSIPPTFVIENEEWYTYDQSPRAGVHVIASVDETTYSPDSDIKMGDHPVIWTNEKMKTRNIYIFMGHSPDLFKNEVYKTLFQNVILWAAGGNP